MSYFGENLRRVREERRMSQHELALQARLGTKTIEKYEANEQIPNTPTILKLSSVLDVPASELLEKEAMTHQSSYIDTEITKLIKDLGAKRAKLILRTAKEFSEEEFLRGMQMLQEMKSKI